MGLQNKESSWIQSVATRFNSALPHQMEAVTAPATFDEESTLYIDTAATVTFTPSGQASTVTVAFPAGWIPVRAIAITSVSAGTVYRAY